MPFDPWLNAWANVKNQSRYRLPSAALIQPCRGAPPEPLGDGTQASFQPSLNSVEHSSGRQESASAAGTYTVREIVPSGYTLTTPAAVNVVLGVGLFDDSTVFGNYKRPKT